MYTLAGYGKMIADRLRMERFAQALRQAIRPGSVVIDIGTGTGIFALMACRFGARRVYAIEPNDAIQLARAIAAANGYAEQIDFFQGLSTHVRLPERADVIVSDLRGVLPWHEYHLSAIVDARQRMLAPGGTMIPQRDTLWAAIVEAPDVYAQFSAPWDSQLQGFNMEPARRMMVNNWVKARMKPQDLLVEPVCFATLDYGSLEKTDAHAEIAWTATRAGTAHGMILWFDTTLAEGVNFSNAPGQPEVIFGNGFFPWLLPVDVDAGDTVSVAWHANLVGPDYILRWDSRVLGDGSPARIKADFKQSTFFGEPTSLAGLQKHAADHVPQLNEDGGIDQFILALMDGRTPLGEIARRVSAQFPTRFAQWQDALTHVGRLSDTYSR